MNTIIAVLLAASIILGFTAIAAVQLGSMAEKARGMDILPPPASTCFCAGP